MIEQPAMLILASHSPRRRELLAAAGYAFEVFPPGEAVESGPRPGESPTELVTRSAYQKAADVAGKVSSGLILACDTVAECDGKILGKPADAAHARQMLRHLSGRVHRVLSGVCLWSATAKSPEIRTAVTTLRMDHLTEEQLAEYLTSGGWRGKAGAFGYQDRLGWVHVIDGSESNVVGLPMELLAEMLADLARENRPGRGTADTVKRRRGG